MFYIVFFTVAYVWSHATGAAHNWAKANSLPTTGVQCYWLNNWISHWCMCWVFIGQLWCKMHGILPARDTNAILYDCIPVIIFFCSERIQHRPATVAWLMGYRARTSPWQAKRKNWAPFSYISVFSTLLVFSK